MSRLPIIGVTDCSRQIGLHAYHMSGDTCVRTAVRAASALPANLTSMTVALLPSDILDGLDGTPITVTPFNIEPIHNNSGASIALGAACDSARLAFCGVVQKKHDSLSYT